VVAVWTDTVKYGGGGPAIRGFGGRLMFYATEKGEPVKVDGTLVVYAFDETNRKPSNAKPDRKYVFTPEQLSDHYSKSKLGHSYSVWIPWDEALGQQVKISLIVRFIPEQKKDEKPGGGVLVGEQCTQVLPGSKPDVPPQPNPTLPVTGAPSNSEGVHTVSHEIPVGPPQPPAGAVDNLSGVTTTGEMPVAAGRIRTTTIYVPPRSNLNQPELPVAAQSMQGPITAASPLTGPNVYQGSLNRLPGVNSASPAVNPASAAPPQAPAASSSSYAPGMCPPNFSAWQPPRNSLSTRFEQARFRAPGEAVAPPASDRGPTTPAPAGSPFAPALPPQSAPSS
jgi:hypothetical protein